MSTQASEVPATWNDFGPQSVATARDVVRAAGGLLDAAVRACGGGDPARRDLVAGLAAILSADTAYSTLRLDTGATDHGPRHELAAQAERASAYVLELVDDVAIRDTPRLSDIRSSCVGYVWTPEVVERLIKPSDQHRARNLYNEWQWQLVLLRDALIPFTDPTVVELAVGADGLTRLSDARDHFVVELMTRRISHATIVDFAAEAVLGRHRTGAFGFTTARATVLPPVVTARSLKVPAYLLSYTPLVEPPLPTATFLVPSVDDYWATPSEPIHGAPRARDEVEVVALHSQLSRGAPHDEGALSLDLSVGFDSHAWSVDLGQALRGHRYAHRPSASIGDPGRPADEQVSAWSGCAVLRVDQSVDAPRGVQLIPTGGQVPLGLALLGRLRPGHVVLYAGEDVASLEAEVGPDLVLIDVRA
jgi:hypothetical protein